MRIVFGRFRIIHSGHINLFNQADQVYMSAASSETDSVEVARQLGYEASYVSDINTLLRSFPESQPIELVAGADNVSMRRLEQYYPNLTVVLIDRPEGAASSTLCRSVIDAAEQDLVELGLAVSEEHASLMVYQRNLELANQGN